MGGEIWLAAAFMGVVATALAFGAQVTVQRFTSAVHTALIFTLEPVFAAVFSVWLQGDKLGAAGLTGGALIVLGMVLAELGPQLRAWLGGRSARSTVGEARSRTSTDLQA
jgi:drug/metabolite transporter (DMT)-like permease